VRVLVCDGSDRGGIAVYTDKLVDDLEAAGLEVCLTAPGERARRAPPLPSIRWGEDVAGYGRLRLYATRLGEIAPRVRALRRALRETRPDVVHVQTPIAPRVDPWLLRRARRRAPVVLTVHDAVPHEAGPAAIGREHRRWRSVDALIVHGADAGEVVARAAPGVARFVLAVDLLPRLSTPTDRVAARARLELEDGPIALLFGLLRPYKGLGLLAEVWPRVRQQLPNARLLVVGPTHGPLPDLDRLSRVPGVDARVGWVTRSALRRPPSGGRERNPGDRIPALGGGDVALPCRRRGGAGRRSLDAGRDRSPGRRAVAGAQA
jgi:glycosyltransferase involved in cell wall biosynthesis